MPENGTDRMPCFTGIKCIPQVIVDGTAAPLPTFALGGPPYAFGGYVVIQNDPSSSGNVLLGDSSNQNYVLTPGSSFPVPILITNTNLIWSISASGGKLNILVVA
jgi:hypothetical protein